jgi:peptide/nickel transport system substrate-binding protein
MHNCFIKLKNKNMVNRISVKLLCCIALVISLLSACKNSGKTSNAVYKDQVVIHALSDAEGLNPMITSDASATQIMYNLFQSLLNYDMNESMDLIPVLAKARPEITVLPDGSGMELTYEIREEAKWDNGSPITAADVAFSFKALKCPGVNSDARKTSVDFINDIKFYPENPRKFTLVSNKLYALAEDASGTDVNIIPEYAYDPKGLLKSFKISDFNKPNPAIMADAKCKEFAEAFNSPEYAHDPDKIVGSGAYKLEKWETGQRNILVKKDNWWGENVKEKNIYFEANPKRLVYETINDFNTALVALKGGKLDVIYVTPVKDYLDLDESPKFKENFAKSEPPMLVYAYLGLNVRDKILKDVKVRQALAHLVDVDQIIEKVLYGLGTRVIGDVLPSHKDDYNNDLALYKYDVEKAKSLLSEAGWADSDGDGILDKVIDGQKTPFKLVYNYNAGNPVRETVGLLSQQWFKAVGIELSIVPLDWSLYLDELKKQKVQMWYGSWIQDPRDYDPRQIWHTESRNGGSNYTGYGNAVSDQLIEDICKEIDPAKRSVLYKKWQENLHNEVPNIFLYTSDFRNIIHNRFENVNAGSRYPGYWEAGFKVKKGFKVEEEAK